MSLSPSHFFEPFLTQLRRLCHFLCCLRSLFRDQLELRHRSKPSCSWKRSYLELKYFRRKMLIVLQNRWERDIRFCWNQKNVHHWKAKWVKRISFSPAENFALAPSDTFFITHVFQWDDSESRATCIHEGVRACLCVWQRERESVCVWERESRCVCEGVCVWGVCVCVLEREKECVCVRVCLWDVDLIFMNRTRVQYETFEKEIKRWRERKLSLPFSHTRWMRERAHQYIKCHLQNLSPLSLTLLFFSIPQRDRCKVQTRSKSSLKNTVAMVETLRWKS